MRSFFILGIGALLCFCVNAIALENIAVGTTTRTMIAYAPSGIAENRPLVFSLHGMSQDAAYQQGKALWETIADTAKFVVVYPNGVSNSWDLSGTSDTDFILAIIDTMYNRYKIDRNRVYLSGFSMGGMMTYFAAHKIADKIAAFAPVSGILLNSSDFTSSRPVPIIHIHGTGDDVVYYNNTAKNTPVQSYLKGWRDSNGCPTDSTVISPYPTGKTSSAATKYSWGPCDSNVSVVHIALKDKGHWYSIDVNSINSSEEIWNFAKNYSLSGTAITSPEPPVVTFTNPAESSLFTAPATISIAATATDADGSVSHIDFFSNDSLIHSEWTAPYEFDWTEVLAGDYTLTAVAYDNDGNTASDTIQIKVENSVRIMSSTLALQTGPVAYQVFDLQGRILGTVVASNLLSLRNEIQKAFAKPGFYIVRSFGANGSSIQKVMIEPKP